MDVENALLTHPDVREVAVVGIPDEQLGQKARLEALYLDLKSVIVRTWRGNVHRRHMV